MKVDNFIIIKGGAYNDIKKALRQWVDLYYQDMEEDFTFQLFKNGRGNHLIQADKRLDNQRFYYLINYLNYPEGIQYKINIQGFTTGKENNVLQGKNLLVYISTTDTEYDNVFVTTSENENFKIDFSGKITATRERKLFEIPTDLHPDQPEIIKNTRKELSKKEEESNKISIDKRFRVISIIAPALLLLSLIVHQYYNPAFMDFSFLLGMIMGVWFYGDYKMLQSDKHYFYCLAIALTYLLYIVKINGGFNKDILHYGALYPLTVLIIQKPARLLFKAILDREPVVDKPPPTFWDFVYMMILLFGLSYLPFIMMHFLIK